MDKISVIIPTMWKSEGFVHRLAKLSNIETIGEIILIDEIFTPDSSRFWPERAYQKGKAIESLDKEFVRSYVVENNLMDQLASVQLPESVIKETTRRYIEIYEILTGKKLDL